MAEPLDLDDVPPLVDEHGTELRVDDEELDDDDEVPALVDADGRKLPPDTDEVVGASQSFESAANVETKAVSTFQPPARMVAEPVSESIADGLEDKAKLPDGMDEKEALNIAVALRAAGALQAAQHNSEESGDVARGTGAQAPQVSGEDALKAAMAEAEEPRSLQPEEVDANTQRMIAAIAKDDFDECEDAIMQGANVNIDCGAGMHPLHLSALRGEMFLTELIIAHGGNINQRDMSGNTPLLYTCHFYRQHGKGRQLVAQLLYHKADPHYRVKDGKLAGKCAYDLMEKACNEPNTDEECPRQMRAMIQLAMEGTDACMEAITKMWMQYKSANKKLYQVSSKKDKYDYVMKNIDWVEPENAKNAQAYTPVKLEQNSEAILEEKFTYLKEYLFTDEGDKVKVYVTFPDDAVAALGDAQALQVEFDFQSFDLKLKTASDHYRLRIDPLHGSIEVEQCKHRVSAGSKKVTLTLAKRHKNRIWRAIQKDR